MTITSWKPMYGISPYSATSPLRRHPKLHRSAVEAIAYVFVLLVGTSIAKDCPAGSPLEDEWKTLHATQLGHDVVRGTVVDGAHPFRQMHLPTCMLASNEVEWRNLWSIAKVDLRPTLPSNMAAVAIIGPGYGCPTARFPEIVDVTDVSDRLLVAYRIHSVPTNLMRGESFGMGGRQVHLDEIMAERT